MKLRPRRSGPSTKGKTPQYMESSDEGDAHTTHSDSDYSVTMDGEDGVTATNENEDRYALDLNSVPEDWIGATDWEGSGSDSDVGYKLTKRRKLGQRKKKGRPSSKKEDKGAEEHKDLDGGYSDEQEDFLPGIEFLGLDNKRNEKRRKKNKETRPVLMWEVWEEEQDRWVEENMIKDIDLENQNEVVAETADAPSDLVDSLIITPSPTFP